MEDLFVGVPNTQLEMKNAGKYLINTMESRYLIGLRSRTRLWTN